MISVGLRFLFVLIGQVLDGHFAKLWFELSDCQALVRNAADKLLASGSNMKALEGAVVIEKICHDAEILTNKLGVSCEGFIEAVGANMLTRSHVSKFSAMFIVEAGLSRRYGHLTQGSFRSHTSFLATVMVREETSGAKRSFHLAPAVNSVRKLTYVGTHFRVAEFGSRCSFYVSGSSTIKYCSF